MVEGRVVLEKIKVLEGRMRYQIEKLVRVAEEVPSSNHNVINDPLAFRPNPQNLMNNDEEGSGDDANEDGDDATAHDRDGIYRPPRLAAMPYTEPKRDKKTRRAPVPTALSSLIHQDPSKPHIESTTGLGSMPSLSSNRARELHRMNEFEEENFTRLVMKKKEMKRRKKDEEDIALGGSGGISGRRRGGGFEDEFGDVLRSVGRSKGGVVGDGYEELRRKGKKRDVLERSRTRGRDEIEDAGEDGPMQRKRSRFEKEAKAVRKRASAKSKK
jgi:U3 small nucleolar ribonucleoprotein protein LCP5